MGRTITWDIEANNLLNNETIDYTSSPYKLKDSFQMHCIVIEDHKSGELIAFYDGPAIPLDGRSYFIEEGEYKYYLKDYQPIEYVHKQLSEFKSYVENNSIDEVVAHNGINYDHLACKLYFDMDYSIGPDSWCGKPTTITDTLVLSKTLNPDRFGGHSLDNLGKEVSLNKLEFRKHIPEKDRFGFFFADMLYYCIRDVQVNTRVYHWLEKQKEGWDWEDAISLEKDVAEIITRQEHRGFLFDTKLAEQNIKELDSLMLERKQKVEPVLPDRPATQAFMKNFTPPKQQFKKDGSYSSNLLKFVEKHSGELNDRKVKILDEEYDLPLPQEPLITTMPATVDDTTHIKDWLVSLGWDPSEWKEKDLSVNSKKEKLSGEKLEAAIDRYVAQTLSSNFCKHRCEYLKTTPQKLKSALKKKDFSRSVKVRTNPSFTVGQDKEMCRDLERLSDRFPYAQDIVEYLTYKHRRNSILGGGLDFEQGDEADKGYLAYVRDDGRIPTPADTCGAATSRFKHRLVANIPRTTSLYGANMRALFGVDENCYQVGYDFDSLEAKEEAHYCWKHERSKEKSYCNSLLLDKPNDVHTMMAKKISGIIKKDFQRSPAKAVKYASTYGATPPKIAKTIGSDLAVGKLVYEAFWEAASPLKKLKDALTKYWENTGGKKFILGIDGRKVPTRSAHAILNSLFQSAGVICAKRAMVIHDRLLKENSMSVDFFKDDWRNMSYTQQLCAYHDEAQIETTKDQVRFKMFDTEDEAEEFKAKSSHTLSDVGKSKNGKYFLAYCKAGALAVESVKRCGQYYNLSVELTAGYQVGLNWADCH